MKTKFYIKSLCAEEDEYSIVELTNLEYQAVKKFLYNSEYVSGGGYCGSCSISEGFNTREEALREILGF